MEEEEKAKKRELERFSDQWEKSKRLSQFAEACASEFSKYGDLSTASPGGKWLKWAKDHARALDPLQNGAFWKLAKTHAEFWSNDIEQKNFPISSERPVLKKISHEHP